MGSTRDDPIVLDGGSDDDGYEKEKKLRGCPKSSGTPRRAVCLDSDEDLGDEGGGRRREGRKRGVRCGDGNTRTQQAAKRSRPRSAVSGTSFSDDDGGPHHPSSPPPPFAPFRVLATLRDENDPIRSRLARHCHTLREILGLDGPDAVVLGALRFAVVANYMIDVPFLLNYAPELLSAERAVVFYGISAGDGGDDSGAGTGPDLWRKAAGRDKVDMIQLVPSDPPRSGTNPLPFRMPFGVHHSKLFLLGYDACLRVVVHTANLIHCDVHLNANGAYVQDFPLKVTHRDNSAASAVSVLSTSSAGAALRKEGEDEDEEELTVEESYLLSCPFEEALVSYLDTYRYASKRTWPAAGSIVREPQNLVDVVRRYDFNSAHAVLIPSVPGRYGVSSCPWGYLKLSKAVKDYTSAPDEGGGGSSGPIVCQFSSMGSLTSKWLQDFACAVDVRTCRSPTAAAASRYRSSSSAPAAVARKLCLVWPTSEEIRRSVRGYAGGDTVSGTSKNVSKDFLLPLYRRWSSPSSSAEPAFKGRCVPHIKTYLQISSPPSSPLSSSSSSAPSGGDCVGGPRSIEWMVLTSHNLSRAAWGEVQNGADGPRLFMRHWELGVFFSPKLLEDAAVGAASERGRVDGPAGLPSAEACVRLEALGGRARPQRGGVPASGDDVVPKSSMVVSLPLPYDAVDPLPYHAGDIPWAVDQRYDGRPDKFGRSSCYDP